MESHSNSPSPTGRNSDLGQRTGPIPRPCGLCRRRKVRCDKSKPFCSNCVRTNSLCSYDEPTQMDPYNPQRLESAADLQKRIARLENLLESMAGVTLSRDGDELTENAAKRIKLPPPPIGLTVAWGDPTKTPIGTSISETGSSVYIDPGTWVELFDQVRPDDYRVLEYPQYPARSQEQVEQLKFYLKDGWGQDPNKSPSRPSSLLFPSASPSPAPELEVYHPPASQSDLLIRIFFDSVERFIGVLHEPTFRRELDLFRMKKFPLHREFEALLFSMYAMTIVSLRSEKVMALFGESRDVLLERYQFAAEKSLTAANILRSRKILTFQALLYYLTFLYERGSYEDATALVGIAIRIAQRLGLQRDPVHFTFSPWIVEMRRRMWNHVFYLDSRGLDMQGAELGLAAFTYDTKSPKNANDNEWEGTRYMRKSAEPVSKVGFTDMTFVILRREMTCIRQMVLRMTDSQKCDQYQKSMTKKREEIELRYLRHFDPNQPFQQLVAALTRVSFMQVDLVARQLYVKYGKPSTDFRLRLFIQAIELLEEIERIECESAEANWDWILRGTVQWHATAIVLPNLCTRFAGVEVERAWRQVEVVFRRHDNADNNLVHAPIWHPLHSLREQALFKRQARDELGYDPLTEPGETYMTSVSQEENGEANFDAMDFPMADLSCPQEFYSLFPQDDVCWE